MFVLRLVFSLLLTVASIKCQCTVSTETIVSSSSSDDVCAVVSTETLSYTCTNNDNDLTWTSTEWTGDLTVRAGGSPVIPMLNINGVTLMESNIDNETCVSSTLTFSGSLSALTLLNNATLFCGASSAQVSTPISVPVVPGSPILMSAPSTTCGSNGNQVTLQWTPPTNTGGQGVMITHYVLTGLPQTQSASCSTGPCDMITDNTTTITGLQCNDDGYNVSVSAVNCRGNGSASDPIMITVDVPDSPAPSFQGTLCIDGNNIRVSLMEYTNVCLSNTMFVVSSNCSASELEVMVSQTVIMLPVSTTDYCQVTAFVRSDCGDSLNTTIMVNGTCPTMPPTTPASTSASPHPTTTSIIITPTTPVSEPLGIVPVAAGGAIAGIVIAALVILLTIIFVCIFCPCGFCMPCRRKCCGCCSEEMICCKCGADDDYSEPTPHVEKQPVLQNYSTETKEKDVETGQPSYPSSAGPMYQDPSTIQRQAAPTGDLYAQPEKPARHQKQKPPPVEMATYQDPNTIQRQAAPTGDLYAQPDKPPRQPAGPAPVYSEVNKSNPSGLVYADLSHGDSPANVRRPQQVADTVYSEVVKESRN